MDQETVNVIIEIPKGSRNKYEFDHHTEMIKFDRTLFSAMHYPSDYGFIPETLGDDGDPLDALVLMWEPTFPGCLVEAKPIGVFFMADEKGGDEKILCVPVSDPHWSDLEVLEDVPPHLLKEVTNFFATYKEMEGKHVEVEGWEEAKAAWRVIEEARQRFVDHGGY